MHNTVPTAEAYCADPCMASSLPYWKTASFAVPEDVRVLRDDVFRNPVEGYRDTRYFKLIHELKTVPAPFVPDGFALFRPDAKELAAHINRCYEDERVTAGELERYRMRKTFAGDLWIALKDTDSGEIAASGIAEYDGEIGEGILDWIQVSPQWRRRGLGTCIVATLLSRLKDRAAFATVSGRADNPTDPYALYVRCGFSHPVIWHVLQKEPGRQRKARDAEK